MVKKRVTDWLKSSLSSASPSTTNDDLLHFYESNPSTPTPPSLIAPPVFKPHLFVVYEEPLKSELKEFVNNVDDASSNSSAKDISCQAQLLAELSKKVINVQQLWRLASQGILDGICSTMWKLLLGYLSE